MATTEAPTPSQQPEGPTSISIPTTSHDTALCIIPPKHLWPPIDRLRSLYDKAYEKWPPHVNLIYPFVRPDLLPSAAQRIGESLQTEPEEPLRVSLANTGVFPHKHDNTIYLHDSSAQTASRLEALRHRILRALGGSASGRPFQMHMTVAQTEDVHADMHKFLVDKVSLVPTVEWDVDRLCLLVRERVQLGEGTTTSRMRAWGTISLSSGDVEAVERPLGFYPEASCNTIEDVDPLQTTPTHVFDDETAAWVPFHPTPDLDEEDEPPTTLSIASYNLLAPFTHPPSTTRYPLLLSTLLSPAATSSILLLQEVTDPLLSHLLSLPAIREAYPYTSHPPPSQSDISPLPSHLNTILLSRFPFSWSYLPLTRKHKSALVATFPTLGSGLVVASVHLTCGLTDGSTAAKKADVARVVRYLETHHAGKPWVVAGDFNVSTSRYTIDAALERKAISKESVGYLEGIEAQLQEAGLEDAWVASREFRVGSEEDEEALPGEEGATYDPVVNEVAAEIVGSGYGMRPQRYDRVYVKGDGEWSVTGFNMFGKEKGRVGDAESYASDHWGVRCELEAGKEVSISEEISGLVVPVEMAEAPEGLGSVEEALRGMGVFPTEEDAARRKEAIQLLKGVLLETETNRATPTVVVVPVGSYALGVWTAASDIDVLCIGPFSANTFFALATQRIRKAAAHVRIIRRVKANTGTMLELEVLGIKMDLQYCPATTIAEQYPQVLREPPTSPVWSLSAPTLSKLKALRDVDYLLRSLHSSLPTFRLAHRFVKTWARSRGIYSARFGFLGSIQISLLLARVIKLLPGPGPIPLPTLLTTFFTHYATFPWATHLVFDPLFHTTRLPYTRTSREPLAILGYFPPALNTCSAASAPSTRAIASEFTLAASQIATLSLSSWTDLLRPSGSTAFLSAFPTYIRLDVQYWGVSPSRGRRFIGWLESRCVLLLVDVNRRAQGLHARMWPARFVVSDNDTREGEDEDEEGRDYRGCYLVGLEKINTGMTKDETKAALGGLRSALSRFEEMMRGDEKYFDARSCWLAGEIVSRSDLGSDNLQVDEREWGEYTAGEDEDEEDDDEEDEEAVDALGMDELDISDSAQAAKKKSKKQLRKEKEQKQEEAYKLETGKKFRTAADVMNRIRWDPEMESSDFLVGYEDRFVGAREKALDAWKTEQTDEEFIPQHRILYFKRKSDGEVVWERRTRRDEIFGSGL
ncbi:2'-5' RNA ligase superfamily-domain-containing protein [Cercophora newfieldiana]|uniref:polynucleotide adenylyltransferase n=1 Tax=Cercophora newfieldiana TaxID=92897 RepID=A0AA39Y181_9PEZI|nr:2'-5' RNA ligase superfamily-domain-containing protein [Cercophora newfieldiana]